MSSLTEMKWWSLNELKTILWHLCCDRAMRTIRVRRPGRTIRVERFRWTNRVERTGRTNRVWLRWTNRVLRRFWYSWFIGERMRLNHWIVCVGLVCDSAGVSWASGGFSFQILSATGARRVQLCWTAAYESYAPHKGQKKGTSGSVISRETDTDRSPVWTDVQVEVKLWIAFVFVSSCCWNCLNTFHSSGDLIDTWLINVMIGAGWYELPVSGNRIWVTLVTRSIRSDQEVSV